MISSPAACADAALIQMSIAGRDDCFSLLMDRHLAAVKKRLSFVVSNDADLEDVIQETQLKVWRHLATFRSESNLRTWMVRIAINEARQFYRRTRRSRRFEPLDEAIPSPEQSPAQRLLQDEANAAVRCAVTKLPPKYQDVLRLRDLCELDSQETAKRLHTTVPAIKTRLFRARIRLSTSLRESQTPEPGYPALSNRVSARKGTTPHRCAA